MSDTGIVKKIKCRHCGYEGTDFKKSLSNIPPISFCIDLSEPSDLDYFNTKEVEYYSCPKCKTNKLISVRKLKVN
jgi:predicted Zn-ribbon and HTH transcriptional regulator